MFLIILAAFFVLVAIGSYIYYEIEYRQIIGAQKLSKEEEKRAEEEFKVLVHQIDLRELLCRAHRDLEKAGVAGFGPWIASCVDNYDRLTEKIALLALIRTGQDVDTRLCWDIIDGYANQITEEGR